MTTRKDCPKCLSSLSHKTGGYYFCQVCGCQLTGKQMDYGDNLMIFGPENDTLLNDIKLTNIIPSIGESPSGSQDNQNIESKRKYCYQCGNKITPTDANFCANCGTPQTKGSISSSSSYNDDSNLPEEVFSSLSEKGSFSGTPYERKIDKRITFSSSNRNYFTDQTSHHNSPDEFNSSCAIPIVDGNTSVHQNIQQGFNSSCAIPIVDSNTSVHQNIQQGFNSSCAIPIVDSNTSVHQNIEQGFNSSCVIPIMDGITSVHQNIQQGLNSSCAIPIVDSNTSVHQNIQQGFNSSCAIPVVDSNTSVHQNIQQGFNSTCEHPTIDYNSSTLNRQLRESHSNSFSSPCSYGLSLLFNGWVEQKPEFIIGNPQDQTVFSQLTHTGEVFLDQFGPNTVETNHDEGQTLDFKKTLIKTEDNHMNFTDQHPEFGDLISVPVEKDEYGDTELHLMVQGNRTKEAIAEIERLKASFSDETFKKYLNQRNDRGMVVLHTAVRNSEILDSLLQSGIDITLLDHSGNNFLHQIVFTFPSAEHEVLGLFRVVFKYQAFYNDELRALLNDNVKAFNSEGFAVVHELTKRSFGDTLEFVKERGANLNIQSRKEKQTPLTLAARERNWGIVKKLCSLDACVNIPTSSGWYVVHAAIEDRDTNMLQYFMKRGVDIYGFKQIQSTPEIKRKCELYMRRRRRTTILSDRGKKKRRRCKCGDDHP